jgi:hypothetical protein
MRMTSASIPTGSGIPRLATRPRTIVRAVHVLASVGWLGLVVVMLVLSAAALTADEGTVPGFLYRLMEPIGSPVIPIFAVVTLVTGLALSVATRWGLLRHWWIVVKLVLSLAVIVTGAALTGNWIRQGIADPAAPAGWLLLGGSVVHLLMLASAMIISVDKPWGKIRRRRTAATTRRRSALQSR